MPGFTVVNLMELPDSIEFSEGIEGRFGRGPLESRDLGVSHWRYVPGYRSSRGHRHGQQEEVYVVLGGSGRVLLDGEVRELRQWDTVRVAPEVMRAFEAGPEGLEFLAVGGPRPEEGDGEMGEVEWPEG
jgi:mannose-6-phosphate isomerase-like protein (cupin superfamily)